MKTLAEIRHILDQLQHMRHLVLLKHTYTTQFTVGRQNSCNIKQSMV